MSKEKILYLPHCSWKNFVASLFHKKNDLSRLSYSEQKQTFLELGIGYSDSLSYWLREAKIDATEICWDIEPLQKKWALENGIIISKNWQEQILLKQIEQIKPSIIYMQDIYAFSLPTLKKLKDRFSFLKKMIIFRGYPGFTPNLMNYLSIADHVFVGSPHLIHQCRQNGIDARLLYHFFDERFLKCSQEEKFKQATFIGSSGVGYGIAHYPRYCWLYELLSKNLIQAWVDEPQLANMKKKLKRALVFYAQIFPNIIPKRMVSSLLREKEEEKKMMELSQGKYPVPPQPLSCYFPERVQKGLFGKKMYEALSKSPITLNRHTLAAKGYVDNIRLFQATGMGTCLITDSGENIMDLFEPDKEIITFSSTEECIEKVVYLLDHENERKKIALAGQKRTLSCHTTRHRVEQLIESGCFNLNEKKADFIRH